MGDPYVMPTHLEETLVNENKSLYEKQLRQRQHMWHMEQENAIQNAEISNLNYTTQAQRNQIGDLEYDNSIKQSNINELSDDNWRKQNTISDLDRLN